MKTKIYILLFIIAILIIYIFIQVSYFKVNRVELTSPKISENINIIQITDFHNNKFINEKKLVKKIDDIEPDLIFLTGDIIDFKTKDFSFSLEFIEDLIDITNKIYFVWGNHELRNDRGEEFVDKLKNMGVFVLDNENTKVNINNDEINIVGLNFYINKKDYDKSIEGIDEKNFSILLSHSPNRPLNYTEGKEDLILCGHTHGGQVRLPIVGPIIAPGQGYFPKYDKGLFEVGNSLLYIDSGLGNSVLPIRFFNRVQISNIVIKKGFLFKNSID